MGVTVHVRTSKATTVVSLTGWPGSGDVLPAVAEGIVALAEEGHALVIDLSGIFLSQPASIREFLKTVGEAPVPVRLVCDRLSGRTLIAGCGLDVGRAYSSLDDALLDLESPALAVGT